MCFVSKVILPTGATLKTRLCCRVPVADLSNYRTKHKISVTKEVKDTLDYLLQITNTKYAENCWTKVKKKKDHAVTLELITYTENCVAPLESNGS